MEFTLILIGSAVQNVIFCIFMVTLQYDTMYVKYTHVILQQIGHEWRRTQSLGMLWRKCL